jgi:hypothetical protein
MSTRFPRAVVVDPLAAHHIAITVDRTEGRVRYSCSCGVDANIPICDLEMLKSIIRDTDNAQVLAWVEYPDV